MWAAAKWKQERRWKTKCHVWVRDEGIAEVIFYGGVRTEVWMKTLGDTDILVAGEAGILRTGLEANSVAWRERRSDYSYSWLATYLEIKLTSWRAIEVKSRTHLGFALAGLMEPWSATEFHEKCRLFKIYDCFWSESKSETTLLIMKSCSNAPHDQTR